MTSPHDLTALVHQLKDEQNTVFPLVNVPYTGLTLSCEVNGEAAISYDRDEKRFFSAEVEAKLLADRKSDGHEAPAEAELWRKLKSVLPTDKAASFLAGFAFPMEIGELGQRETEDYIAIVHIDGNNMGQKFADCDTLTKRKNMSLSIRQATISAFTELLEKVEQEYDTYSSYLTLHMKDGKRFLPVRPLVLGGDDMTFVCAAKVAIPYAKFLMEALMEKHIPGCDGIASCAGIAILPSSYPFFRGYEMAEQLCDAAKKRMRVLQEKRDCDSCWLDFAMLHGEQAPTLEQIRAEEYGGVLGNLHFGPIVSMWEMGRLTAWQHCFAVFARCVLAAIACRATKSKNCAAYSQEVRTNSANSSRSSAIWDSRARRCACRRSRPGSHMRSHSGIRSHAVHRCH